MSSTSIAHAVRATLLAAGTSSFALFGAAFAQERPAGQATLDEIVVTGSRIAQPTLESASPLQIIGADDIAASGVVNIQEILLQNPTFGTPTFSRTNSNFPTSSAGVATVDLRNLGTARTLVLVDGRRFVAGIPGESAVDLNTIPTQFIERVDILTGGASAVYGSDAVAGVVNIIYRKNFEGIEFDGQYGASAESDDRQTQLGLTIGTNTSDGRGNIIAHLGYTEQGAVYSRDRARSAIDQASEGAFFTGDPADFFTIRRPFFSSFAPQGRFFAGADQYTYNAANQLITGFSTNGSPTRAPDGFNRSEFRTIAVPTERYLFASRGHFEFTDDHRVFFEGTIANTQATSRIEPFPLASDDIYPSTGGQVPIEFETFVPVPGQPGQFTRQVVRNPLVPLAIYNSAEDEDGDGLRDIFFTRRMSEFGDRGSTADRDTFRIVGGFEGTVVNDWRYEAFYAYGQTKESQVGGGQVNVLNFRNALEAIPGPDGTPICRDENARAQGCVPVSVFGRNAVSPAAVQYIQAPGLLATYTSQVVAGVNVSGSVVELPAGALGIAVGAEYREEFSRSEFDPLQQAGLNAGNAIPRTEGKFDVSEAYLEGNVPLLRDLPAVHRLNLRAAVRVSDYSTVGSTESWNAGVEWAPIPQVRLRGIRAQSTRAPNINELFAPPSQTFPSGLTDPCLGVTATSTTPQSAACRAAPGVLANIQANGAFTLSQADLQGISGFNRGNPELSEERGKSWTFGAVITPDNVPFLRNFAFTIDYFNIEIDDAIVPTPRQFILDQCYTGNAEFCQFITRRPQQQGPNSAGSLQFIDTGDTNSGGYGTEGVDLTVSYRQDLPRGALTARLAYTYLIDGYLIPLPGAPEDPFVEEIGASKHRGLLQLGYALGPFSAIWRTNFIGKAYEDDQFLAGYDLPPKSIGVGSVTYHDVQLRYTAASNIEVFLGANNVFDKEPPPIITGFSFNTTGAETDAGTYDAIGRRFYGGVKVRF